MTHDVIVLLSALGVVGQVLAGLLLLASLFGAVSRTRETDLSPPARLAWIVVCGVVGLPALMALWLLYPKRETVDDPVLDARPAIA